MTAQDIKPLIEGQYIDLKPSNTVKVILKKGSIFYCEFLKHLQVYFDMLFNRWLFSSAKIETLLDGNDIESIIPYKTNHEAVDN